MATWIAHLRIAEKILEKYPTLDKTSFAVGNIGPDCGMPNEDWSSFDPPKKITHWQDETGKIEPERFFDKYLAIGDIMGDRERFSFYLGYYIHLLADLEWGKLYKRKKLEPLYKEGLEKDPKFVWTIKEDWYAHDFIYLRENPQSIFYTCFKDIESVPDYTDFYPNKAFERQVDYIKGYYLGEADMGLERPFIYLSRQEMNEYVELTIDVVEQILGEI